MKNILLIDAGNSRLKWVSMDGNDASVSFSHNKPDKEIEQNTIAYKNNNPIESYSDLIKTKSKSHDKVLLVSVQGNEFAEQARKIASKASLDFINAVSPQQLGCFKNAYKTPALLGVDRFVAMLAAHEIAIEKKARACIVIDCGTAVTIDAIDVSGQHLGGLIMPGLQLCSTCLLTNTQQLFAEVKEDQQPDFNLLTNNTSDAILSGSFYGLSGAIKETCFKIEKQIISAGLRQPQQEHQHSQQQSEDVVKIICGGDAKILASQLSADFLIHTDLVLQGARLLAKQTFNRFNK